MRYSQQHKCLLFELVHIFAAEHLSSQAASRGGFGHDKQIAFSARQVELERFKRPRWPADVDSHRRSPGNETLLHFAMLYFGAESQSERARRGASFGRDREQELRVAECLSDQLFAIMKENHVLAFNRAADGQFLTFSDAKLDSIGPFGLLARHGRGCEELVDHVRWIFGSKLIHPGLQAFVLHDAPDSEAVSCKQNSGFGGDNGFVHPLPNRLQLIGF